MAYRAGGGIWLSGAVTCLSYPLHRS
jgi:hypothetical protein